jgi:hypothetical protein
LAPHSQAQRLKGPPSEFLKPPPLFRKPFVSVGDVKQLALSVGHRKPMRDLAGLLRLLPPRKTWRRCDPRVGARPASVALRLKDCAVGEEIFAGGAGFAQLSGRLVKKVELPPAVLNNSDCFFVIVHRQRRILRIPIAA